MLLPDLLLLAFQTSPSPPLTTRINVESSDRFPVIEESVVFVGSAAHLWVSSSSFCFWRFPAPHMMSCNKRWKGQSPVSLMEFPSISRKYYLIQLYFPLLDFFFMAKDLFLFLHLSFRKQHGGKKDFPSPTMLCSWSAFLMHSWPVNSEHETPWQYPVLIC